MRKTVINLFIIFLALVLVSCNNNSKIIHKVLIDYDNGQAIEERLVENGESLNIHTKPLKKGHTFLGWQSSNIKIDINSPITKSLEINASWSVNQYSLSLYIDDLLVESKYFDYNSEIRDFRLPEKDNYKLVFDREFPERMPDNDIEINGRFVRESLIVTYLDYDGTVLANTRVGYNQTIDKLLVPDRVGFKFLYWELGGKKFNGDELIKDDITLKAIYETSSYKVMFYDFNNNLIKEETVEKGYNAIAPALESVKGYTFKGWDNDYTNVRTDLIVKPIYEINYYNVSFYDNNNQLVDEQVVMYGKAAIAPDLNLEEGTKLEKWDHDFSFVENDLIVKAIIVDIYYDVVFVIDGIEYSQKVKHGSSAIVPNNFELEGYDFIGWDNDFSNVKTNLIITATYQRIEYIVTYYGIDNEIINNDVYYYGDKLLLIDPIIVDGYEFLYWEIDGIEVSDDYMVTNNLSIKAKYKLVKKRITINQTEQNDNYNNEDVTYNGFIIENNGYDKQKIVKDSQIAIDYNLDVLSILIITGRISGLINSPGLFILSSNYSDLGDIGQIFGAVSEKYVDKKERNRFYEVNSDYVLIDGEKYTEIFFDLKGIDELNIKLSYVPVYVVNEDGLDNNQIKTIADFGYLSEISSFKNTLLGTIPNNLDVTQIADIKAEYDFGELGLQSVFIRPLEVGKFGNRLNYSAFKNEEESYKIINPNIFININTYDNYHYAVFINQGLNVNNVEVVNPSFARGKEKNAKINEYETNNTTSRYQAKLFLGGAASNVTEINNVTVTNMNVIFNQVMNNDVTAYIGGVLGFSAGFNNNLVFKGEIKTVNHQGFIGGIVSYNMGNISDLHSSATINGKGYIAGVVAENSGSIKNLLFDGDVSGYGIIGGISALSLHHSTITNFINSGRVELFGENYEQINNSLGDKHNNLAASIVAVLYEGSSIESGYSSTNASLIGDNVYPFISYIVFDIYLFVSRIDSIYFLGTIKSTTSKTIYNIGNSTNDYIFNDHIEISNVFISNKDILLANKRTDQVKIVKAVDLTNNFYKNYAETSSLRFGYKHNITDSTDLNEYNKMLGHQNTNYPYLEEGYNFKIVETEIKINIRHYNNYFHQNIINDQIELYINNNQYLMKEELSYTFYLRKYDSLQIELTLLDDYDYNFYGYVHKYKDSLSNQDKYLYNINEEDNESYSIQIEVEEEFSPHEFEFLFTNKNRFENKLALDDNNDFYEMYDDPIESITKNGVEEYYNYQVNYKTNSIYISNIYINYVIVELANITFKHYSYQISIRINYDGTFEMRGNKEHFDYFKLTFSQTPNNKSINISVDSRKVGLARMNTGSSVLVNYTIEGFDESLDQDLSHLKIIATYNDYSKSLIETENYNVFDECLVLPIRYYGRILTGLIIRTNYDQNYYYNSKHIANIIKVNDKYFQKIIGERKTETVINFKDDKIIKDNHDQLSIYVKFTNSRMNLGYIMVRNGFTSQVPLTIVLRHKDGSNRVESLDYYNYGGFNITEYGFDFKITNIEKYKNPYYDFEDNIYRIDGQSNLYRIQINYYYDREISSFLDFHYKYNRAPIRDVDYQVFEADKFNTIEGIEIDNTRLELIVSSLHEVDLSAQLAKDSFGTTRDIINEGIMAKVVLDKINNASIYYQGLQKELELIDQMIYEYKDNNEDVIKYYVEHNTEFEYYADRSHVKNTEDLDFLRFAGWLDGNNDYNLSNVFEEFNNTYIVSDVLISANYKIETVFIWITLKYDIINTLKYMLPYVEHMDETVKLTTEEVKFPNSWGDAPDRLNYNYNGRPLISFSIDHSQLNPRLSPKLPLSDDDTNDSPIYKETRHTYKIHEVTKGEQFEFYMQDLKDHPDNRLSKLKFGVVKYYQFNSQEDDEDYLTNISEIKETDSFTNNDFEKIQGDTNFTKYNLENGYPIMFRGIVNGSFLINFDYLADKEVNISYRIGEESYRGGDVTARYTEGILEKSLEEMVEISNTYNFSVGNKAYLEIKYNLSSIERIIGKSIDNYHWNIIMKQNYVGYGVQDILREHSFTITEPSSRLNEIDFFTKEENIDGDIFVSLYFRIIDLPHIFNRDGTPTFEYNSGYNKAITIRLRINEEE